MKYAALFVLLIPVSGWSAIAVSSQTFHQHTGAAGVDTWTFNCNGGNLLVLAPISSQGFLVVGSSFNGVNLTMSTQTINGSGPTAAALWYLVNPSAGSNTMSITWSDTGGSVNQGAGAVCFSGVNTSAPIDVANCSISGSGGTTVTVNLVTTVNNDFLDDVLMNNSQTITITSGSGTIQWFHNGVTEPPFGIQIGSTKGPVSTGSNSMTYVTTNTFSQPTYCGLAVEPAAVAGGAPPKMMKMETCD